MNSAQIGALSEAKVEAALLGQGYQVLRPVVPDRYDLAVRKDWRVWFVQVKTGRIDRRNGTLKASWDKPYQDVHVLAVVWQDHIYYIPTHLLDPNTTSVTIRFSPTERPTGSFLAFDMLEFPFK